MRILVTGSDGFVGRHVTNELTQAGHTPLLHMLDPQEQTQHEHYVGDLRDREFVDRMLSSAKPDGCIHLAGIAFVPVGWEDPKRVLEVNTIGVLNLLEAVKTHTPATRLLVVTSAEVYGRQVREENISETDDLRPENIYAVSKAAADQSALLYSARYDLPIMTARPHNHIGPGQSSRFVISSFASQLIDIAAGREGPVMRVGNLESKRDFTDVRDVARAYRLIIEKGQPGNAYNIASGSEISIQRVLNMLCGLAGAKPDIQTDPARFRPTDLQPILKTEKIQQDTGWKAEFSLEQTLQDILNDLRQRSAP